MNIHSVYANPEDRARYQEQVECDGFVRDFEVVFVTLRDHPAYVYMRDGEGDGRVAPGPEHPQEATVPAFEDSAVHQPVERLVADRFGAEAGGAFHPETWVLFA